MDLRPGSAWAFRGGLCARKSRAWPQGTQPVIRAPCKAARDAESERGASDADRGEPDATAERASAGRCELCTQRDLTAALRHERPESESERHLAGPPTRAPASVDTLVEKRRRQQEAVGGRESADAQPNHTYRDKRRRDQARSGLERAAVTGSRTNRDLLVVRTVELVRGVAIVDGHELDAIDAARSARA